MTTTIKEHNVKLGLDKLHSIRNIATILEHIDNPIEKVMLDKKCTIDEAIKYKETADQYIRKYGIAILRNSADFIENILKPSE